MGRPDEIAAYSFKAAIYCPGCIVDVLPTGHGEAFDGWKLADGAPPMSTEANLDEIAAAFTINRRDEFSFDGDYFPKVIFGDMIDDETCEKCGRPL